jgi:hypothetical protein
MKKLLLLVVCLVVSCSANYGHPYAVIYPPPGLRSNINGPGIDPSGHVYVGSNTAETIEEVLVFIRSESTRTYYSNRNS